MARYRRHILATLGALISLPISAPPVRAQTVVDVLVDSRSPGQAIPTDWSGVSMEMQTLLPDQNGQYYLRAGNERLLATFRQLGIHSLRVGGNTADNPLVKVPAGPDIDSLFAFARAAGLKVIYTLRLRGSGDPQADVATAKYVIDHYRDDVVCFEIGNEPNVYTRDYAQYHDLVARFVAAITARAVAPDARFCGPNTTPGKTEWARQFAVDFGRSTHVSLITQHAYPGGNARKVVDVSAARDSMLSRAWVRGYERFFNDFGPVAAEHHLPYRIEETNSFYNGGLQNASDTHAAALWGLDYMYWWATHGAAGINFHTGDHVAAADESAPCRYALFWTATDGYEVHPLGYAAKAFDLGSHGRMLPVRVQSPENQNISAYAVLASDSSVYVTIINKETGHDPQATSQPVIRVAAGPTYTNGQAIRLASTSLAATSDETLGGAPIRDDASWAGRWTRLRPPAGQRFFVALPAASAVIVHLTTSRAKEPSSR